MFAHVFITFIYLYYTAKAPASREQRAIRAASVSVDWSGRTLMCRHCKYHVLTNNEEYLSHMEQDHPDRIVKLIRSCAQCLYVTDQNAMLMVHEQLHQQSGVLKCPHCPYLDGGEAKKKHRCPGQPPPVKTPRGKPSILCLAFTPQRRCHFLRFQVRSQVRRNIIIRSKSSKHTT